MPWAVSTEMRSTEETAGSSWPSTSNRMPLIRWASSPATLGADWTSSRPARQEYLGVRLGGPNPARFLAGLRRLPPAPPDTLARAAQTVLAVLAGPPEADVVALEALADSEQALLAGIASYVLAYAREALGDLDGALSATRRALAAFERRGSAWLRAAAHSRIGEMCLRAGEAGSGDTTVLHLSAALAVAEAYGARSTVKRVRALIVGANLQRGALDQADASWN